MVALPRIIAKRWPGSGVEGVVNAAAVVRGGASLLDGRCVQLLLSAGRLAPSASSEEQGWMGTVGSS